jgi:hypothetical protein
MKNEFEELQNPPDNFVRELVNAADKRKREEFKNNLLTLNNSFAFASVHSERADFDQVSGRKDLCKLNGIILKNKLI